MLLTAFTIASTLLFGLASYALHKFRTRISPNIPFAGGDSLTKRLQVPVEYGKDPVEFLRKTRQELGDVFYVDLFLVKIAFFLGAENNKAILRAAEDDLSFWKQIKWATGPKIGITLGAPGWHDASMKISKSSILSQERIEVAAQECQKIADEHFERWAQQDSIPLFESISYLVLSFLMVMFMGEEFYRNHGAEIIPLMDQFERDLQHPILRLLPWSLWGLPGPGRRHIKTADRFSALTSTELDDIIANPEKHEGRTDYFYHIVSRMGPNFRQYYGTHIMSMTFGGHANVALTVPWMYLHARRHPGAMEKIKSEALRGPGESKPFLEACLRETGRLYTNTAIMRMTAKSTVVGGHPLPPNTLVACSPAAAQREDAKQSSKGRFEDARRWLPERFMVEGAYAEWFNKAEFVQFGMGQHQCPGERLAKTMIFDLILRTWMESYDIEVIGGLEEGIKGVDGVGAEAAWTEENFGTPSVRGEEIQVTVRRRV